MLHSNCAGVKINKQIVKIPGINSQQKRFIEKEEHIQNMKQPHNGEQSAWMQCKGTINFVSSNNVLTKRGKSLVLPCWLANELPKFCRSKLMVV